MSPHHHILFYDGLCGLCNRLNRFVLKRDPNGVFRFASLQGEFAQRTLPPLGKDPADLDTFCILADAQRDQPRLLQKGRAALFVFQKLGWPWRALTVLGVLPTAVLDFGYDLIARNRYRIFGRYETCPLPDPTHRKRFIER